MRFLDSIFKGKTIDWEDPKIYGNDLKSLRETVRQSKGSIPCLKCNSNIPINFIEIERQIRQNQKIAQRSARQVIFCPDLSNPKVCKTCKGLICHKCANAALATKKDDETEIRSLVFEYQPMILSLNETDRAHMFAMCLSQEDSSTILCPNCKNDLLLDVDHITD